MRDALTLDHGLAALAVEGEWHGENGLESIPLRATRRRRIGLATRDANMVVED
jgi:hypothetical protein